MCLTWLQFSPLISIQSDIFVLLASLRENVSNNFGAAFRLKVIQLVFGHFSVAGFLEKVNVGNDADHDHTPNGRTLGAD